MKIGVSSYSFSRLMREGKLDLMELPAYAAKFGYDSIELLNSFLPDPREVTEATFAKAAEFKTACEAAGVGIAAYLCSSNFLGEDGPEAEAEYLIRNTDVAASVGAPVMRFDACWNTAPEKNLRTFEQIAAYIAPSIRKVAAYAETKGVMTCTENHGFFFQDSIRVLHLISLVNHKNFGSLTDMGNFLCADEDPIHGVSALCNVAVHAHAKDFIVKKPGEWYPQGQGYMTTRGGNGIRGTIVGHGQVPVRQCLQILKNAGFDGTVVMEFEGVEDVLFAVESAGKNLREIVASLR